MAGDRLAREARYHDERFAGSGVRGGTGRFYAVTAHSKELFRGAVRAAATPASSVLECGCGPAGYSLELADYVRSAHAVDLSAAGVRTARARAQERGASGRLHHGIMDAEHLAYASAAFDVVFGSGILHHLELGAVAAELARVLKPGGVAIFYEPLGHNLLINLYRRLTPDLRSVDEHPLREHDLSSLRRWFGRVDVRRHHLLSLGATPLRNTVLFAPLLRLLEACDRVLLALPWVRRQAWVAIIRLSEPSTRCDHGGPST